MKNAPGIHRTRSRVFQDGTPDSDHSLADDGSRLHRQTVSRAVVGDDRYFDGGSRGQVAQDSLRVADTLHEYRVEIHTDDLFGHGIVLCERCCFPTNYEFTGLVGRDRKIFDRLRNATVDGAAEAELVPAGVIVREQRAQFDTMFRGLREITP
jgi:hypothetical protein